MYMQGKTIDAISLDVENKYKWGNRPTCYHAVYLWYSLPKKRLPVSLIVWFFLSSGLLQIISPSSWTDSVLGQLNHKPLYCLSPVRKLQWRNQHNLRSQCHGLPVRPTVTFPRTLFRPSMLMEVKRLSSKWIKDITGHIILSNRISMIKLLLKSTTSNFVIGTK